MSYISPSGNGSSPLRYRTLREKDLAASPPLIFYTSLPLFDIDFIDNILLRIMKRNRFEFRNGNDELVEYIEDMIENIDTGVFVYDPIRNNTMEILSESDCDIELETEGFQDILVLMDQHSFRKYDRRIFQYYDENSGVWLNHVEKGHPAYYWDYDFNTGSYITPQNYRNT